MLKLLTITLLAAAVAPQVRLTMLNETEVAGELVAWTSDEVVLDPIKEATSTDQITFLLSDLLSIQIDGKKKGIAKHQGIIVELADGSIVSATEFQSTGDVASVSVASLPSLEPPVAAVRSVRIADLSQVDTKLVRQLETEWRQILDTEVAGDIIVIRKPGAESLSYVVGAIGDVGEESVQFTLDEETLEVNRSKVFGIVYYREVGQRDPASAKVEGPGLQMSAEGVTWNRGEWVVETSLVGTLRLPIDAIHKIDFSSGRLLYLSDLEPVRSEWTPPPGATAVDPWFQGVAFDRGFYSPKLELEYPASSLPPEEATSAGIPQRVIFEKGLALRSRTELTYRVPKGFARFRATAGIDPRTRATGLVELHISGDKNELIKRSIGRRNALAELECPVELECNVEGVKELTLIVDYGEGDGFNIGAGDNLHLANARFTK